jgi:hypothetical protein
MFKVRKSGNGNKLIQTIVDLIRKQSQNTSRIEMEEIIYGFLHENQASFKRNNPKSLKLLQSEYIIMVAYTNDMRVNSQIEIFWFESKQEVEVNE